MGVFKSSTDTAFVKQRVVLLEYCVVDGIVRVFSLIKQISGSQMSDLIYPAMISEGKQ